MAGRLVAKWLFLRRADPLHRSAAPDVADWRNDIWPPEAWPVTPGELDALPEADYGSVEILPGEDGAPGLTSRNGVRGNAPRVSIAHSGGWVVAATSRSLVGVDMEVVVPRRPSFYDECLTERDRGWMRGASAADTERLATLLWAVKEAFLKTGASTAGNVWGIGAIDLAVATPAEQVARSLAAGEAASLKPLDVAVAGRGGPAARVAYGTRGGLPLAVMVLAPNDMTHT